MVLKVHAWLRALVGSRSMASDAARVCRVAALQLSCTEDKTANQLQCQLLVEKAASQGASVVFLPEAFDFVAASRSRVFQLAERRDGATVQFYQQLARRLGVWLSLGGFHERPDTRSSDQTEHRAILNTHLLIDNEGGVVADYSKTHLFDVHTRTVQLSESSYVRPGSRLPAVVSSPAGRLALMICYDVRFPEMALLSSSAGAQVLCYPSAFTEHTGQAHWHVLMRARALDAQCYVVSAAQTGRHSECRASYGHAIIVDPWGVVLAETDPTAGSQLVCADLDLGRVLDLRREMPLQQQRRHDLYTAVTPVPQPPAFSSTPTVPGDHQSFQFGSVCIEACMVFFMTRWSYAFVNRRCVVAGHVLVAVRGEHQQSVARLHQLPAHQLADLFHCAQLVQRLVERVHEADSSTVCVQDGPHAGQTVAHVHVHVLPRRAGDLAFNDDVYRRLHEHDKDDCRPWRQHDDMRRECLMLRAQMAELSSTHLPGSMPMLNVDSMSN